MFPFEISCLNNPDLKSELLKSYQKFKFDDNYIYLNTNNNYIISNDHKIIISEYDVNIEDVLNKNVFYYKYTDKWNKLNLMDYIYKCKYCFQLNFSEICDLCNQTSLKNRIKSFIVNNKYLCLPINRKSEDCNRMYIYINKNKIYEFDVCLNESLENNYWAYIDISSYINDYLTIVVDDLMTNKGLNLIKMNDKKENENVKRPLIHFSQEYGWINDMNGLVYFKNEYHLFYQYNPFGTCWATPHWGHATSNDLINWEEKDIALHPFNKSSNTKGMCFSGSGEVINDEIVLCFSDTNVGEVIAKTTDNIEWKVVTENVIPKHMGRDPKIKKIDDYYILIVYSNENEKDKFKFYKSNDLNDFEFTCEIDGFKECPEFIKFGKYYVICDCYMNYIVGTFIDGIFNDITEKRNLCKDSKVVVSGGQCFNNCNKNILMMWINLNIDNIYNQLFSFPIELTLNKMKLCPQFVLNNIIKKETRDILDNKAYYVEIEEGYINEIELKKANVIIDIYTVEIIMEDIYNVYKRTNINIRGIYKLYELNK